MVDKFLSFCVFWMPLIVAFIYFVIASAHLAKGNKGLAIMWAAYGAANCGMLYALRQGEGQ